jgi:hypothetical protein
MKYMFIFLDLGQSNLLQHLLTGVWVSPTEHCYLWMGGFRPLGSAQGMKLLAQNSEWNIWIRIVCTIHTQCNHLKLISWMTVLTSGRKLISQLDMTKIQFLRHYKLFMLLQTLLPGLDHLTEQVVGICNLQQSSQQAEEALSQGLDQLHESNGPCSQQADKPWRICDTFLFSSNLWILIVFRCYKYLVCHFSALLMRNKTTW